MKLSTILLPLLILVSCQNKAPKITTGLEGKPMPKIDLLLEDSTTHLDINNIQSGRPAILFAFEPWCPYCKAQTKSIIANIKSLNGIDFYFLTNSAYPGFKEFYKRFELEKYPNIKAGIDYNYTFARYFKTSQVPVMAIYDPNKKLKQLLTGKNYISTIKDIAFNKN
jgi:thiol-disulfide isomerase/thioredoxin